MRYIVLHYLISGVLLLVIVWLKLYELGKLLITLVPASRRFKSELDHIGKSVLCVLAAFLFLDPLLPGVVVVEIQVRPATVVTTLDHLAVRIVPVGMLGAAGGTRTSVVDVNERGVASVIVQLHHFESSLNIDLLDESLPKPVVQRHTAYVSPFTRRQVWPLKIRL